MANAVWLLHLQVTLQGALLDDPDLDYLKVEDQTFMQCTQYWVIGKQSPNSKNAEKFIDYICDPKIYAECLNTYPAISNNEEALNYVSDDYKKIEGMFEIPDDKKIIHSQFGHPY